MTDLRAPLFARSLLLQAGFSDERRQGLGFAWAVDPALAVAYSRSADGFRAARLRHLGSFNTHPCASGLILGACAELEARAGAGEAPAAARAAALKAALGAALAGAADAFFWGALRPLAAAAAVLAALAAARLGAAHPLAIGAAAGLAVFNGPALFARWRGVALGLRGGEESALVAARLPVQRWLRAARLAAAQPQLARRDADAARAFYQRIRGFDSADQHLRELARDLGAQVFAARGGAPGLPQEQLGGRQGPGTERPDACLQQYLRRLVRLAAIDQQPPDPQHLIVVNTACRGRERLRGRQ